MVPIKCEESTPVGEVCLLPSASGEKLGAPPFAVLWLDVWFAPFTTSSSTGRRNTADSRDPSPRKSFPSLWLQKFATTSKRRCLRLSLVAEVRYANAVGSHPLKRCWDDTRPNGSASAFSKPRKCGTKVTADARNMASNTERPASVGFATSRSAEVVSMYSKWQYVVVVKSCSNGAPSSCSTRPNVEPGWTWISDTSLSDSQ
mmetsp:Transcript_17592/g.35997  ORF Transcript_17592/g.35997 Transcript_17592/m.35997 type:complete len:202 (-) Transcript_17592:1685-2290(-)